MVLVSIKSSIQYDDSNIRVNFESNADILLALLLYSIITLLLLLQYY